MACLECNVSLRHVATLNATTHPIAVNAIIKPLTAVATVANVLSLGGSIGKTLEVSGYTNPITTVFYFSVPVIQPSVLVLKIDATGEIYKERPNYKEGHDLTITATCKLLEIDSADNHLLKVDSFSNLLTVDGSLQKFLSVGIAEVCPFDYVHSCYGAGYWMDDLAWADDDAWRDN